MIRSALISTITLLFSYSAHAVEIGARPAAKPVDVSVTDIVGRRGGASMLEEIRKQYGNGPEAEKKIKELHAAVEASNTATGKVVRAELDKKYDAAFGPKGTQDLRDEYYRSAMDAISRIGSVRVVDAQTGTGRFEYDTDSPVGKFFDRVDSAARKLDGTVPAPRREAIMQVSQLGDADLVRGVLKTAERFDRQDGTTEGKGTTHLTEVGNYVKQMMAARDGRVYDTSVDGKEVPVTTFRDSDGSRQAMDRSVGSIAGLMKDAAATNMTANEFHLLMKQVGAYTDEMGNADANTVAEAERALRGLSATYGAYAADLKANAAKLKASNKALETEKITGTDLKGAAVEMKDAAGRVIQVKDGLTDKLRSALNEALKDIDVEKTPLPELMARVEAKLKEKGMGPKEIEDVLHLLRERATKAVVEKIWRLELLGKIAAGDTEKFFCYKDPATGEQCTFGLDAGLLAGAFKMCQTGGAAGAALPGTHSITPRTRPANAGAGAN